MKTRIFAMLLALCMVMLMSACGSSETSSAAAESASASEAESSAEASASEEESAAEASAEEEEEPTVDELFDELLADADGACVKLQCYDHRGTPIRNAQVLLSSEDGEETLETDFSGYVLISDLKLGTEYTLTLTTMPEEDSSEEAEEPEPYGTVKLTLTKGSEYAGGTSDDEAAIEISVADGDEAAVDMAITADDDNSADTGFVLSRIAEWAGIPED